MKKIILIGFILLTLPTLSACLSNSSSGQPNSQQPQILENSTLKWSKASSDAKTYHISFSDVEAAVQSGAKFYDVRSQEEYGISRFELSENLPLSELEAGKLPELDKQTPIYIHCRSGARSNQASQLLKQNGFEHVYDLGGINQVEAIGGILITERNP